MNRREFIAASSASAGTIATTQAFAKMAAGGSDMHPPKYKALEQASFDCVATGNDCLRHCLGMYKMGDMSMGGCANSVVELVAGCGALVSLAAINSTHTGHFAKVVEMLCSDCKKECDKFPMVAVCKACADACMACAEECHKIGA